MLSVGRSGTSLVTRSLNLMGVHLGACSDLLPPSEQNETGYWENAEIYRVNEALLEIFGGSWYRPPDLRPGWTSDPRVQTLREGASHLITGLAEEPGRRWGFKDPRTAVVLRFWRELIGEMHYVICVRKPAAVISSVEETGLPGAHERATVSLWLKVNALILSETVHERRTFVFYEDWFEDAAAVVAKLADFAGGDAHGVDGQAIVQGAFRPELRRADERANALHTDAPEPDAMYAHLRLVAGTDAPDPEVRLRQAHVAQGLADAHGERERLRDGNRGFLARNADLQAETEALQGRATALERTVRELESQQARSRQVLEGLQQSASWRVTAPLRAAKRRLAPNLRP